LKALGKVDLSSGRKRGRRKIHALSESPSIREQEDPWLERYKEKHAAKKGLKGQKNKELAYEQETDMS